MERYYLSDATRRHDINIDTMRRACHTRRKYRCAMPHQNKTKSHMKQTLGLVLPNQALQVVLEKRRLLGIRIKTCLPA